MLAVHQDVCAASLGCGLECVAGNGELANDPIGGLQHDLARCALGPAIVFNVVSSDLDIMHITLKLADAGTFTVADMISDDDDLV